MNTKDRKRHFQDRCDLHMYKKPKKFQNFQIVNRVRSQKGFRSKLVLMYGSPVRDSVAILGNAIRRSGATFHVRNIGEGTDKGTQRYALYINNEHITEGNYLKEKTARKRLAKLAIEELKKTCFTIIKKIRPIDSPMVKIDLNASTSADMANGVSGVGAKMLLKMGWSGGGLGAQEQGITDIIKPSIQIDRQGFGTERSIPIQKIKNALQDYVSSDDINSISFPLNITKEERVVIHSVAQQMNLRSSSYGSGANRRLVVQKKINPWRIINSLLEIGGQNKEFKLILPTNFTK